MRIDEITIKNFRSIKEATINPQRFNIFVGQNNHGKSNLFEAIEWFYTGKGNIQDIKHCDAEDESIEVEIKFSGVQEGIKHISNSTNQEKLKKVLDTTDVMCVRRTSKSAKDRFLYNPKTKDWKKQPTGADSAFNNCMPRFEFIEATKNFRDVSAYKNTTPIGQMLGGLVEETLEKDDEYKDFIKQFDRLFGNSNSKIRQALDGLSNKVSEYLKEQFPDCVDIKFHVKEPGFDDLLKNYDTEVNDGVVTKADDKGDGMQRALMLSIIKAHADFRRTEALGRSFLFFIDEAELHLHPTGQRQLKQSLLELTSGEGTDQVFITTHSSVLIADGDQDDNQAFFRVQKENKKTTVENISRADKHTVIYDMLGGNPADLLLPANFMIVEGPSEVEFLNKIINRFYQDKPEIHILPAYGDDEAQNQTMNAINKVFLPLKIKPIYKNKLTILCDMPDDNKQARFDQFRNENTFLERNGQLFVLDVNGLEDYYPDVLSQECERENKVKKAKWMANRITQNQFEQDMDIMHRALNHCWGNAYVTEQEEIIAE